MDQTIPTPAAAKPAVIIDETISDVNSGTVDYIFHSHKQTTLIVSVCILAYIIIASLISVLSGFAPEQLAYIFSPAIVAIIIYIIFVNNKVLHLFYQQFAEANNLHYEKNAALQLTGSLFNMGHGHSSEDIITGTYDENPLTLFNYTYITGSGKNQQTHHDTVFQIEYPSVLAPILLLVGNQFFGDTFGMSFGWEKIKPEGNFDKSFDLYTKKGFEIETLQIFTPDFMEKLLAQWPEFNMEFNGNKIIIFHTNTIKTKVELQKMYSFVQFLITQIEPEAKRMEGSVKALEALQAQ